MFALDYQDKRPIYIQIVEQIENLYFQNVLKPGDKLPSVRSLALDLATNPNTIARAYSELERKGIIVSVSGKGSFISPNVDIRRTRKDEKLEEELSSAINTAISMGVNLDTFMAKAQIIYEKISNQKIFNEKNKGGDK